jgi:hypothetical protein
LSRLPATLLTAALYGATVAGSTVSWMVAALLLSERVVGAETALLISWAAAAGLFVLGVLGVVLLWRRVPDAQGLRFVAVLLYGAVAGTTVAVMAFVMMVSFNS